MGTGPREARKPAERILRSSLLPRAEGLLHGFSTRLGGVSTCFRPGDLNLGFTPLDDPAAVRRNRYLFLEGLEAQCFQRFSLLQQRHTTLVDVIRTPADAAEDFLQPAVPVADATMTNVPGVLLTVQTADCVPVLLFDPRQRAVAAIHAGWRGTVGGIVQETVNFMRSTYATTPSDLVAAIGPSIGPASYIVGEEVRSAFAQAFPYADLLFSSSEREDGCQELRLDLWEANRQQLLAAGLDAGRIEVLHEDTAARTDRFFSHRAEAGRTGRQMSAIGLVE